MKQYNILGGIDNLKEKKKMKNYKELENEVIKWADNKGILTNGTPYAQANKTIEEANEILSAIIDNDKAEIIDGLGDVLVTIIIQAKLQNVDLLECLQTALNVITKRTGYMKDGMFYKD
jgi:NTP pyrophosphatase (non-canonical NTP hydrolase)